MTKLEYFRRPRSKYPKKTRPFVEETPSVSLYIPPWELLSDSEQDRLLREERRSLMGMFLRGVGDNEEVLARLIEMSSI